MRVAALVLLFITALAAVPTVPSPQNNEIRYNTLQERKGGGGGGGGHGSSSGGGHSSGRSGGGPKDGNNAQDIADTGTVAASARVRARTDWVLVAVMAFIAGL